LRYWDSSALVPLIVSQARSREMEKLYRSDAVVITWWGTRVECDSALARLEREAFLTPRAATQCLERLDRLAAGWQEIQPSDVLRVLARRFLRAHDLRVADALQLGAAMVAAEDRPATLELVCLDDRLALAAERQGFPILGRSGGVRK
jgi:predicted nucleic acid-binding protein